MTKKLLWSNKSSNTLFDDFINKISNYTSTNNYYKIHKWSIQHKEQFWDSIWDFTKIIGDKKIKDNKLRKIIVSEEAKFWKFISSKKFLDINRIKFDEKLLLNFYKNKGYYNVSIESSSAKITHYYNPNNLVGKQIIAVCNFPTKNIAGIESEVLVLGAMEEDGKVVLVHPSKNVANGLEII